MSVFPSVPAPPVGVPPVVVVVGNKVGHNRARFSQEHMLQVETLIGTKIFCAPHFLRISPVCILTFGSFDAWDTQDGSEAQLHAQRASEDKA